MTCSQRIAVLQLRHAYIAGWLVRRRSPISRRADARGRTPICPQGARWAATGVPSRRVRSARRSITEANNCLHPTGSKAQCSCATVTTKSALLACNRDQGRNHSRRTCHAALRHACGQPRARPLQSGLVPWWWFAFADDRSGCQMGERGLIDTAWGWARAECDAGQLPPSGIIRGGGARAPYAELAD